MNAPAALRSALDVMRRPGAPMTARQITDALMAEKAPTATRKQAIDIQAAILAPMRKRDGETVVGEGSPTRWELKVSEGMTHANHGIGSKS
jgi:hypothetical protein